MKPGGRDNTNAHRKKLKKQNSRAGRGEGSADNVISTKQVFILSFNKTKKLTGPDHIHTRS
jgi:hypothetical protein